MPYDEMLSMMKGEALSSSQGIIAKEYIAKLDGYWKKYGGKIVTAVEKASGLKFKQDIDCYVVSDMAFEAISHPFTLKMCSNLGRLNGIMVHELLHVLFVQHHEKILPVLNGLPGDHHDKVHFPVLLCERKVFENLHGSYKREKRVEDLDEVWRNVNKVYKRFKSCRKGVVPFLEDYFVS